MREAVMSLQDLEVFLRKEFPQIYAQGDIWTIDEVGHGRAVMRMAYHESQLRPGGTISGPAMMTLADLALYVAILASIGPVALAVTTNCAIDFMRKPSAGCDLLGEARILKLGRTLAVGDVLIRSDGHVEPVARASLTYSIPPAR